VLPVNERVESAIPFKYLLDVHNPSPLCLGGSILTELKPVKLHAKARSAKSTRVAPKYQEYGVQENPKRAKVRNLLAIGWQRSVLQEARRSKINTV